MVLERIGGTNYMKRNSVRALSRICEHGQCRHKSEACSRIAYEKTWVGKKKVPFTLVKEFESNDMRDVIRRIFVRQTKINCSR